MKDYFKLEQNIIDAFSTIGIASFENELYELSLVGKPRPSDHKGECKTDVYVLLHHISNHSFKELKISVKNKKTHEWQESKLTKERAVEIFGSDYENIISTHTLSIKDKFESTKLFYRDKYRNTEAFSLTMGWRLEITVKPRNLSVPLDLPNDIIVDSFYKGSNLPIHKKDCLVNNQVIKNAGVANYILYIDDEDSTDIDFILNHLIPLENFVAPPLYLAFIANNYRFIKNKIDGNRPLAVYVQYHISGNELKHRIFYENPLKFKGKELSISLINSMKKTIDLYDIDDDIIFSKQNTLKEKKTLV